jgi:hypothetical protein
MPVRSETNQRGKTDLNNKWLCRKAREKLQAIARFQGSTGVDAFHELVIGMITKST